MKILRLFLSLSFAAATVTAGAEARLAQIFQDNMVLQRNAPVPVWGWADPGATVTVEFAGQSAKATAAANGYWKTVLTPLRASGEGRALTARVDETNLTRSNVVVGEVWLAAGQSNMNHAGPDRPTGFYPHPVFSEAAGRPDVRITRFGRGASLVPRADLDPAFRGAAPWTVLRSDAEIASLNVPVAFARLLRDRLGIPIGIIHVAVSGTNQGAWMKRETLAGFPGKGEHADYYQELLAHHQAGLAKKGKDIRSWSDFERAMTAWAVDPKGRSPAGSAIVNFPTALYNTRIHPLAPYALRGAIWHQGEGGPGGPYGKRLAAMAAQWREHFGQDFFFLYGTLTRNTAASPPVEPRPTWFYRSRTSDEIRKAPGYFGPDGGAAMVELYDIGDHETHFLQKTEAGRRFALAALNLAHDGSEPWSGPFAAEVTIAGGKAVVRFDRVGGGLVYRPSIAGISGVHVKGGDGGYHWAEVTVAGKDAITISHPDVAEITAIGYAANDNPHETLFNSAGLPASPFKVNMERLPWSGQAKGIRLVTLAGSPSSKPSISVTHVRRGGYVFQLLRGRRAPKAARVTVRAWLPEEWDAYVVETEKGPLKTSETTEAGRRFATFTAPVDGAWIIVAASDKVRELRGINRY